MLSGGISSSNSYIGSKLKILRSHCDLVVYFPSDVKTQRAFISSIASGSDYQKLKRIFELSTSDLLDNFSNRALFSHRPCYPYLSLILNKSSDREFRHRETLYNCNSTLSTPKDLLPKSPPAFISPSSHHDFE